MNTRTRLYVAGIVAALTAYVFATVAFTGVLDLVAATVFLAVFAVVAVGFERFVAWAERFDAAEPAESRI
ncbi:hypothetical protein ACFQE1_12370 [Halobium palmae]|uniref:Uncharacterized protein n=1 Tax=Halobium palmae TaxID=1776492 RepID=A0ABD5S0N0_9EURY